jgi:hypothetical protein
MQLNLKRLISRTEIKQFLAMLTADMDAHFCISDASDNILFSVIEETSNSPKVPIKLEDGIIGWVSGNEHSKTKIIAAFLSLLANSELEKKELGREVLEKYREITLWYETSERLAENLNPSEVAKLIIDEVAKLIPADNISVLLLNEETGGLDSIAVLGDGNDPKFSCRSDEGIKGHVLRLGKAEIVNDLSLDSRYLPGPMAQSSLICAPLKIKDRVIGLITASTIDSICSSSAEFMGACQFGQITKRMI